MSKTPNYTIKFAPTAPDVATRRRLFRRWSFMRVIAESNWSWMLFEENEHFYLSVLCGGVGMYLVEFELSASEVSDYKAAGTNSIEAIAQNVRQNSVAFQRRQIPSFSEQASVKSATTNWRTSNAKSSNN